MATYKDGYMGVFSGRLGPAVAYTWRGRQCLRSHQPCPRNPRTKQQQSGRTVFGVASRLGADMIDATEIGLRGIAVERMSNVHNIFVSLNRHCIVMEYGEPRVDYTSLRVAEGELPDVAWGPVQCSGAGEIGASYGSSRQEGGSSDDYVYLYIYVPSTGFGLLSMPSARCGSHVDLAYPASWVGREAHCYGFVWNHDLCCSTSAYLGHVTL